MNRDRLTKSIKHHEGLRLQPYYCTEGKLTIGYGRNLESVGISPAEAEFLLTHDINKAEADARQGFPTFRNHSPLRQEVIVEMVFNLGLTRLLGFKKMIQALRERDYTKAAREMLDSKWAVQVGPRAVTLAERMRTDDESA